MADSPEQGASHGGMDHGFGNVEPLLVVTHQPTPAGHPAEVALDHPAASQDLEPGHRVDTVNDFDDDIAVTADGPLGASLPRFAPGLLAVHHQGDVVDGTKQHEPDEASEPPVDRLPWWEVFRQHAPATARARHVPPWFDLSHASPADLNRVFRNRVG